MTPTVHLFDTHRALSPDQEALETREWVWQILGQSNTSIGGSLLAIVEDHASGEGSVFTAVRTGMPLKEAVTLVKYAAACGVPINRNTLPLLSRSTIERAVGKVMALMIDELDLPYRVNLRQVVDRGPDCQWLTDLRPVSLHWHRFALGGLLEAATLVPAEKALALLLNGAVVFHDEHHKLVPHPPPQDRAYRLQWLQRHTDAAQLFRGIPP